MAMMDLMMDQVLRSLNIDREEILPFVQNIGQTVGGFDAKVSRVEAKLDALLRAQGIDPASFDEVTTHDDAEPERFGTGG